MPSGCSGDVTGAFASAVPREQHSNGVLIVLARLVIGGGDSAGFGLVSEIPGGTRRFRGGESWNGQTDPGRRCGSARPMTSTAQRRGCSMRWPPATMRKSRRRQTTSPAFNVGPDASASGRTRSGSGLVDAPGRFVAGRGRPAFKRVIPAQPPTRSISGSTRAVLSPHTDSERVSTGCHRPPSRCW